MATVKRIALEANANDINRNFGFSQIYCNPLLPKHSPMERISRMTRFNDSKNASLITPSLAIEKLGLVSLSI